MKSFFQKLFVALLVVFFSLTFNACEPAGEEGDCHCTTTVVNNNDCCCDGVVDGDTDTGVLLHLYADEAIGQEGVFSIYLLDGNTETNIVLDDMIVAEDDFYWDLEPGYYGLSVIGLSFFANAEFEVIENQVTEIGLTLNEYDVVTWDLVTRLDSPMGLLSIGDDIDLFRFDVSHDWPYTYLTPAGMSFAVETDGYIDLGQCHVENYTLAGWRPTSPPVNFGWVYEGTYFYSFQTSDGTLDDTIHVWPGSVNSYQLSCDVNDAEPGARVKVYINGFAMEGEPTLWRYVPHWPESYWLNYPSNTMDVVVRSDSPSGLVAPSIKQDIIYLQFYNDSAQSQEVTDLGFTLGFSEGFQVHSCEILSIFGVQEHPATTPIFNGYVANFSYTNMHVTVGPNMWTAVKLACDTTGSTMNSVVQSRLTGVYATIPMSPWLNLPLYGGALSY